ncbi:MAG: ATPase domain-containing protein [Candidatus Altiarchaeota archaeon]|nr:ATPase domain-containing protein [Candidatus Altiarchaeota archaeon]
MERVKTGIPGVDEILNGGFVKGNVIIISGSPGIGKSNFAMQYLYNGAAMYGEAGVYVTVEDVPEKIREYARDFGWDFEKYEKEGKLSIVAQPIYSDEEKEKRKEKERALKGDAKRETLVETIKRTNAKRVVLDSVTLFKYLFKDDMSRRINLLNFINMVKEMGCTTLMVAEQHESTPNIMYTDEHFLADGLVVLFWLQHKDRQERCFRVIKMRGSSVNPSIRPMDILETGIVVYPTQVPLSLE